MRAPLASILTVMALPLAFYHAMTLQFYGEVSASPVSSVVSVESKFVGGDRYIKSN